MSTAPAAGSSRRIVIVLSVVGGVLLLAVVALVFLLLGRGLNAPQAGVVASPTPTAIESSSPPAPTPAEAEAPAAEPVDTSPRFTSFDAVTEVQCPQDGEKPEITFSWTTANAVEVWYTSGHEDAIDDNYMQVPLNGSQNDLTDEHLFPCNHRQSEDYTVTLLGPGGEHVSEFVTVTDLNWGN